MDKQKVIFKDLGIIEYKSAWDYQENLLQENVKIKSELRGLITPDPKLQTQNYFLFCEHPPVYTLGKSGKKENVLLNDDELAAHEIAFFNTNRGGDITFHGPQQIVGYPILDLEKYYTDIGKYLRNLEEMVIVTLAAYGIKAGRSKGETGVWIDADIPGRERKICAIGVRCSRWITMHGFALNVNTDLGYFDHIIPCGIQNKQVTSIQKELGHTVDYNEAKEKLKKNFEKIFDSEIITSL
ncbi:MAG: lipoyl(octanoyl) transferase LipB [Ferruginibacter sp.]|nr:lipoyl(octanoyl) transferase LipB [Ferruginibacter sp.]